MAKKKSGKKVKRQKKVRSIKDKINLVLKNLILFSVLSLLSFILYSVSSSEFYMALFSLISMILGFIAFSFFIALLIFLVLKFIKK